MRILDRYVLQKFAIPFIYCFLGFIAIWLVFDLSDNGPDFIEARTPLPLILEFYGTQIPEIIVISLPVGALLALLYSLTQMSRSNEIVAILTSGVGVVRIIVPLMVVGLLLTGVTWYFNYEQAPHAAAIKKQMLKDIKRGKKKEPGLTAHLFVNREDVRTWYMRRIRPAQMEAKDVQVVQQDADGNITKMWYTQEAKFRPATSEWVFDRARVVDVDLDGNIVSQKTVPELYIKGWTETPWRIASSALNPDYLGIGELKEYLKYNADFPEARLAPFETQLQYRYAIPWVCLLVIFIAAPMGIVFSRRGILGGVATAIGLFFSFVFVSSLFLALGKGSRITPFVAAWGPMILFGSIALGLLWFRATNRDLPKFKIPGF